FLLLIHSWRHHFGRPSSVTDILPTLPVTLPTLSVTLPTDIIPTTVPTLTLPTTTPASTTTLHPLTGLAALLDSVLNSVRSVLGGLGLTFGSGTRER
ncbi:hypothetical protein CF336_g2660, partial [Tilletia laevis]